MNHRKAMAYRPTSCYDNFRLPDIETLEKVQKKATEILSEISHLKYSDRLRVCKLPTLGLHYRRIRGDMTETYKILTGKYDI